MKKCTIPQFVLLSLFVALQPSIQTDTSSFLIYNEDHNRCVNAVSSTAVQTAPCDVSSDAQRFRWISSSRIISISFKLCLGAQNIKDWVKILLLPCNELSPLQIWECKNETLFGLKGQPLHLNYGNRNEQSMMLYKGTGTWSRWQIYGTKEDLCSRGYQEIYSLGGNSFGKPCLFPFKFGDKWYAECIVEGRADGLLWCSTETDYDTDKKWGFCPTKSGSGWDSDPVTGVLYQRNTQSVLTWYQARTSCQQQGADLLSISELHEQSYISGLTNIFGSTLWIGLNSLEFDSGWQWINGHAFRYLNWAPGHPSLEPGLNCAALNAGKASKWESMACSKKLGYICRKGNSTENTPPPGKDQPNFCPAAWVPYAGHCYYLQRIKKTWSDALAACHRDGADLASVHNIEEHSFIITQTGYLPTDELWIGLNDQRTQNLFEWSDRTHVTFTKWTAGEPSHVINRMEDCVLIKGKEGRWADHACETERGYICKKKSSSKPDGAAESASLGCQAGWVRYGSHCYNIAIESKTFNVAKLQCEQTGARLVDVANRYENAFLISLVGLRPEKYFWIGLCNTERLDRFQWSNGDKVKFTHFNAGMPERHQGCVAMLTGTSAGLWDVLDRNSKQKYICKKMAEGITTTQVPPTTQPLSCPTGWIKKDPGSCIQIYQKQKDEKKTWLEARDFCRAIGGDLVSFHSQREISTIPYIKGDIAWIGFNMLNSNSGFVWTDETPSDFENWGFGEPNNYNNQEHCAECGFYYGRKWNDRDCESYLDWICQIPIVQFNMTSDGWIQYNGSQYFINEDLLSMEDARSYCKKNHADLVVITGQTERKFLWKQISRRSEDQYYIGMRVELDKSFSWVDGSPVVYTSWDQNEPNFANNEENCVTIYKNMGFWNDINCGVALPSICKRSSDFVNTTMLPSTVPPGGCTPEWTMFRGRCFKFFNNKMTWHKARDQCISHGGNLVSIQGHEEQAFLTTLMLGSDDDVWIGFNDVNREMRFLWSDGKGVSYTNWAKGQPSSLPDGSSRMYGYFDSEAVKLSEFCSFQNYDCVVMVRSPEKMTGVWKVEVCGDKRGFICKRTTDSQLARPVTTALPQHFFTLGNDSYKVQMEKMSWDEARRQCKADDADLASVLDAISQAYTILRVSKLKEPLWIGLNSNLTSGRYRWVDNWLLRYSKWATGEPQNNLACVYIDTDGDWKTATCNNTYYSLCKRSPDIAPTDPPQMPGNCPESKKRKTWIPFRGHCYAFMASMSDNWAHATVECMRIGASLVSIEDSVESKFILQNLEIMQDGIKSFWIGMHRSHTVAVVEDAPHGSAGIAVGVVLVIIAVAGLATFLFLKRSPRPVFGEFAGFVRIGGYPVYNEAGLPMQDDVKPQSSSSWYGHEHVSDPISPQRSKNITYSAAQVKGVYSSVSYSPQNGSSGFGPMTNVYKPGSDSDARSQVQGALMSSAGSGSLVPIAVATESESMSIESLPKPAQLNYQTLGQSSSESVASSSQQLVQTSSQSSGQLVQVRYQSSVQPIVKPHDSRLQVGSRLYSGTVPVQTSSSTFFGKPLQQRSESSQPSYQLGQDSYGSGLVPLLSGQQLAQARYQPVALLSLQQSSQASSRNVEQAVSQSVDQSSIQHQAQSSSQSVDQSSALPSAQASYPSVVKTSGLQSAQASYQPSGLQPGQALYPSVSRPSGKRGQASYPSVVQTSGLQSAQASYPSVVKTSGLQPGQTLYPSVSRPSGKPGQASYPSVVKTSGLQSAQASYHSVSRPSGKRGQASYPSVVQTSGLQSAQASYPSVVKTSGLQPGQALYPSVVQTSGIQPGQTLYPSVSRPSGPQPGQALFQSVVQPSGLQSAQASYQSVSRPSGKQGQASYPSVVQTSGLQSAQASYPSVVQTSGLQSAQASYPSVVKTSGLQSSQASYQSVSRPSGSQPGQAIYPSVSRPSGLPSAQAHYPSVHQQPGQASYQSLSQSSSQQPAQIHYQSVSQQPGFQIFSVPEQSSYGSHSSLGSQSLEQPIAGFVRIGGYPVYDEAGLPMQEDVEPQSSSSWYGHEQVSDPISPQRSKNITYSAAQVKGVYSSVSYSPQNGSSGFGPMTNVYKPGSDSDARSQVQGSLMSSAGSGSLVPIAVATESESMSIESLPKPAQLNYQTLGQSSSESVASSSQQLVQTSSQSSGQLVQVRYQSSVQPIVKPHKSRLQVGSRLYSGTVPVQTSSSTFFGKPLQQRSEPSQPSYQLGQDRYGSGLVPLLSGQQLAQARYQPVALLSLQQSSQASRRNLEQAVSQSVDQSSIQHQAQSSSQSVDQSSALPSAQASYPSVVQTSGLQSAQASYPSVVQTSGLQSAQASYPSVVQTSGLQSAQASYQSVSRPSGKQGQASYPSVVKTSGLQSAQASYPSVVKTSGLQPGQTLYPSVSRPSGKQGQARYPSVVQTSGLQSAQASYPSVVQTSGLQSAQASYPSVVQPSGLQSAQASYQSVSIPSGKQGQASYPSVVQTSGLQSAQASYPSVIQTSGPQPGQALYPSVVQPSGLQSAQTSYQSVSRPSGKQGQASYPSVVQTSGLQSAQASYPSVIQTSGPQPGQALYPSVVQPSGLQSAQASYQSVSIPSGKQGQASYPSVVQTSGLQSAQASYPSVIQTSGLQPGQTLYPSVSRPSGKQGQASYPSVIQTSGPQPGQTIYPPVSRPSGKEGQASYPSVVQPSGLQSAQASYHSVSRPSGKQGQASYPSVAQTSGLQSAQASYQSVSRPSGPQPGQALYPSVVLPSGLQSAQASYPSVVQTSGPQSAQASYPSVVQPSGLQSAQASYQSLSRPSGKQGQASYPSVIQTSGPQPGQALFQSVVQPSGLPSAQAHYSSVHQQPGQASYQSLSQSSSQQPAQIHYQSVFQQPGFQIFSVPEQSSYGSHSSLGSQSLEQPSNVPLSSSYESVQSFKPGFQDPTPPHSRTTQNKRLSQGILRLLQQVKS
ncbi:Macrophage mannose receptor 1 [Anabarilius grahami]|uniref:Macrophage mannose receptor 1 n=1 Tax=Anabarilius grahami TaxID=495550 RepID=A0A3N0YQ09_ANAGA|nr:Macrophage mannose receptor 1 [Anabarilius grahami]